MPDITLQEHMRRIAGMTSEAKKKSSSANGKKGGRPKGSKNKPKPTE